MCRRDKRDWSCAPCCGLNYIILIRQDSGKRLGPAPPHSNRGRLWHAQDRNTDLGIGVGVGVGLLPLSSVGRGWGLGCGWGVGDLMNLERGLQCTGCKSQTVPKILPASMAVASNTWCKHTTLVWAVSCENTSQEWGQLARPYTPCMLFSLHNTWSGVRTPYNYLSLCISLKAHCHIKMISVSYMYCTR